MKKTIAFLAAAILFLGSAATLKSAEQKDYIYGFITSCGVVDYVISEEIMCDDEALEWLDWFEEIYCD